MKILTGLLRHLFCLLLLATTLPAFSQSFVVNTNNTNFQVNTTTALEAVTTTASAFSFSINSRNRDYNLYAGIVANGFVPSSVNFDVLPFEVKLRSVTGVSTAGGINGEIQLLEYPPTYGTLALNATRTGNTRTAVWTYDLILNPVGYAVAPGTYNFTVSVMYTDVQTSITRNFPVTLNVHPVLQLSLVQNAATSVSFGTSAQYTNGISLAGFTTHNVKSNLPWTVSVAAQNAYFTPASSGADNNVPCSVMSFKTSSSAAYIPLSVTTKPVMTGNAGNSTSAGNTYNLDVQFNPGYGYSAGIYNLALTYTLTAQ